MLGIQSIDLSVYICTLNVSRRKENTDNFHTLFLYI